MREMRILLLGAFGTFLGMFFAKFWSSDYNDLVNSNYGFLYYSLFSLILIFLTYIVEMIGDFIIKRREVNKNGKEKKEI